MDTSQTLFDVKGKIVVLTGGSGVLGGYMARGLAVAGAHPVLLARNKKNLDRVVKELSSITSNVFSYECDVLNEQQLTSTNDAIMAKFGRIDVLINAAGGNKPEGTIRIDENIFDLEIADFKKVTDLNLYGTVLPTLLFGRSMAKQKKGSIINLSSMATQRAITRVVGYSAAKAAIDNFTRWMAVEMAHKFGNGMRVNAIAPGFFLTEQNRYLLTNKDGTLTERGKTILNITPFGRFGNPEELIGPVLWLASDASSFVTGTIIPIDGGFSAYSGL
jgi:NAD(P)-dependent dehydrogenase (short-subunit alcohol dehydrogenase family)